MMVYANITTPLGRFGVEFNQGALCRLQLRSKKAGKVKRSPELEVVQLQVDRYFVDPQFRFDLSLTMQGTEFQRRVWQYLREIPSGEVVTYGEIANQLRSSAQAVGNACRSNPIPLIVPCHRVVSISGIGGFSGSTEGEMVELKRELLAHEGVVL